MNLKNSYYVAGIVAAVIACLAYFIPRTISGGGAYVGGDGVAIVGDTGGNITIIKGERAAANPREQLQRLGISWSVDNFRRAVLDDDRNVISLFLDGGVKLADPNLGNTPATIVLANLYLKKCNYPNFDWIIDGLVKHGLDLNKPTWFDEEGGKLLLARVAEISSDGNDCQYAAHALVSHGANIQLAIAELQSKDYLILFDLGENVKYHRNWRQKSINFLQSL